jgi:hypothetical protein
MRNRVLYFPYINVPKSTWLTQVLFYWDQLSSIVPHQFTEKPDSLDPYMRSLVQEELVFQVIPEMYIHEIPRFDQSFQAYLRALGPEMEHRRRTFKRGSVFKVHIEKLSSIGENLVEQRLARRLDYSWYAVESATAEDFMSYLATALGQLPTIDSTPVTDKTSYLERFSRAGVNRKDMARQLDSLRIEVLDRVLCVPKGPVAPSKIREFKQRHGTELVEFRRRVERELIDTVSVPEPALRRQRLEIFYDEADEQIRAIQAAMKGAGWNTARGYLSIIAAVPGAPVLLGLAGAVWNAMAGEGRQAQSLDFAYAAHERAWFT